MKRALTCLIAVVFLVYLLVQSIIKKISAIYITLISIDAIVLTVMMIISTLRYVRRDSNRYYTEQESPKEGAALTICGLLFCVAIQDLLIKALDSNHGALPEWTYTLVRSISVFLFICFFVGLVKNLVKTIKCPSKK